MTNCSKVGFLIRLDIVAIIGLNLLRHRSYSIYNLEDYFFPAEQSS